MKSIGLISLWILLFYACAEQNFEVEPPEIVTLPVNFVVSDDSDSIRTRGTPIDSAGQMTDMGVFCSWTDSFIWSAQDTLNKMFNVKLVQTGGRWEYTNDDIYWENTSLADHYTFFAYSPYISAENGISVKSNQATPGIPVLSYTVPTSVAEQPDLMVAEPRYDLHPTGAPVVLNYRHALTCVGFKLIGNNQPVSSIKIKGISTTADLSMNGDSITWLNKAVPSAIELTAGLNTSNGTVNSTPTLTDVMNGNGYLMMIPQTLGSEAKVTVTFSDNSSLEYSLNSKTWLPGQQVVYAVDTRVGNWAGSNIYWDGTKLTFDDTGDRTHAQYIGAYFMWGSLVALTPSGANWTTGAYEEGVSPILYIPNPDPATNGGWNPATAGNTGWGYIPRAGWDGTTTTGTSSNPNNGGSESNIPSNPNQQYLTQIHDSTKNIGDICKYLTEKKWAPGATEGKKWRMPTATELQSIGTFLWNSGTSEPANLWGTSSIGAGRSTNYAQGYAFFPASGFRQNYDAVAKGQGENGSYWSTSPGNSNSYDLFFYSSSSTVETSYRYYGFSVRCVQDQ